MYATAELTKHEPLAVTLPRAARLRGRMLDAAGQPTTRVMLLPDFYARAGKTPDAGFGVPPRPLTPQADGTFSVSGLHPNYGYRLLACIDPKDAAVAGVRTDFSLAPVLWLAVGDAPGTTDIDLGDLRIDRLSMVRIEVRRHDGEPVPGARLHVTGGGSYNSPIAYAVDRVGRLQFPLPPGEIRIGAWLAGGGVASVLVRSPNDGRGASSDPLTITLTKPVVVRGVVVDAAGKPVAGARVYPWDRPSGVDRELAAIAFLSHVPSQPTGVDGRFEVTLPLGETRYTIRAYHKASRSSSPQTILDVDQARIDDVQLTLEPAK